MAYSKKAVIDLVSSCGSDGVLAIAHGSSKECSKEFKELELSTATLATTIYCYSDGDTADNHTSYRYMTSISATIEITYYGDENTKEHKQLITIYPNNYYERSKALPVTLKIPIDSQYIKSMKVSISNNSGKDITIKKFVIKREVTSAEDYAEYTGISNTSLSRVEAFNNGCKIYYDNQESPTTLVFEGDSNGNLVSVLVNPNESNQRRILFNRNSSNL